MIIIQTPLRVSLFGGGTDFPSFFLEHGVGHLLHESWQLKKQLASQLSNSTVDDMYETARRAGAIGGKISGAGGGGFLLLYCPNGQQESVRDALKDLQELPFKLGKDGSKVIFDYER
ncbi:MAG TPA: hypothetical protein VF177_21700 [Anaerolineae bacterium]